MPANWEQLHRALIDIRLGIEAESADTKKARDTALACLERYAGDPALAERVDFIVRRLGPELRCALPAEGPIGRGFFPDGSARAKAVIASDGSQVNPDRHQDVLFGIINIGAVIMRPDSGEAPTVLCDTTLLHGQSLSTQDGGAMSEGDIALMRDEAERAALLRLVRECGEKSIGLLDGPIELWGAKDATVPGAFERSLKRYLNILTAFRDSGSTLAGYVDKPGADLVVRLLEALEAPPDISENLRRYHPLRAASDRWLFAQVLLPRQRSAVFALRSSSTSRYLGNLAIHFFYLNVGTTGHPSIARVEVPKWVADAPDELDRLHIELLAQCAQLGARPYPYILHRAHETASISNAEKEEIKLRLVLDLLEEGLVLEDSSGKSTAKASSALKGGR